MRDMEADDTIHDTTAKNAYTSESLLTPKAVAPGDYALLKRDEDSHQAALLSYWHRLLCDTWFYELIAIGISVASLIAIGAILIAYDQQRSPQLRFGLTLNAIISILATAMKAGLVFAVASSISQLKWCWMQKIPRPLRDLQRFDEASRGFSGAFTMLFTRSARSLASVGAVITILAVAIDPFVQQLAAYPIRTVLTPSSSTLTKRSTVFNTNSLSTPFMSAVEAAFWSEPSQFARNPTCASGNCTWPPFRSVGWCSKCEDITSSASLSGCTYTVDGDFSPPNRSYGQGYSYSHKIPCKIDVNHGAPGTVLIWGDATYLSQYSNSTPALLDVYSPTELVWTVARIDESETDRWDFTNASLPKSSFAGVENPFMVFAHASLKLIDETNPPRGLTISHIDQCVLSMCEQTYKTSVAAGVAAFKTSSTNWGTLEYWNAAHQKTVSSKSDPQGSSANGNNFMYWVANLGEVGDVSFGKNANWPYGALPIPSDPEHSASYVDANWHNVISSRMTGKATTTYSLDSDNMTWTNLFKLEHEPVNNFSSSTMSAIHSAGMSSIVGNVAASLSQLGLSQNGVTVSGNLGVSEAFVNVRWEWFILPCLLELAGIGFLITTIIVSKHQKVYTWKSSVHALLYHGLEKELLEGKPVAHTVSGMEQVARSVNVRLNMSDDGERVEFRRQR